MPVFRSTKHLSAARTKSIIPIIEALREVSAAITVGISSIRNLKIGEPKRRTISLTTPNSLILIRQWISLS